MMRMLGPAFAAGAILMACASFATACINESDGGPEPPPKRSQGETRNPLTDVQVLPPDAWEARLRKLAANPAFGTDPNLRNDYAVALIRLGRSPEAIAILEALEKQTPGQYITAVNLGTAYELSGKDEQALQWIREGVKRNPASHDGTEWLHVRILQAKLALARDGTWLQSHSILDGGPALTGDNAAPVAARPVIDDTEKARDARDIAKALAYQLTERMGFVRPRDPIVAELLLELASLTALSGSVEQALPLMKRAGEYGPARAGLQASRQQHFESLLQANPRPAVRRDAATAAGHAPDSSPDWLWFAFGAPALYLLYRLARWGHHRRRPAPSR